MLSYRTPSDLSSLRRLSMNFPSTFHLDMTAEGLRELMQALAVVYRNR
jgi:hypothetical protein